MAGSPPYEQPWSEYEKIALLAEIVKAGRPNLTHLLNFVNGLHPFPQWGDIVPPPGRTPNQCRQMFNNLIASQPQLAGPQTPSPMPHTLGPLHQKRPFENTLPAPREIRPKPPPDGSSNQQPTPNEPPKKKRGRPTKAEVQSRAGPSQRAASMSALGGRPVEQVIAGPSTYATLTPPMPQAALERPPSSSSYRAAEMRPPPPASNHPSTDPPRHTPAGFSISDIVTPNPPKSNESSSSSGKRRRAARATRSDPVGAHVYDTPTAGPSGIAYYEPRDGDDQQQQPRPSATALGKRPDLR